MRYLLSKLKILFTLLSLFLIQQVLHAQIDITGTVYDSTKIYFVPGVIVKSTGGNSATTDSAGVYHITATEKDSLSFYYNNRPTVKFPVSSITNYTAFDLSLRVRVNEKYKFLKEVKVFSKNYRQDSLENRLSYAKIFNYDRPGISTTYSPGSPPGFDLDALINMFHFRRNKLNLAFQKRLIEDEQDKYINYRFNNTLLKRVTGLTGDMVEKYKMEYKPPYEFLTAATELEFYEYILATSAKFKKQNGLQ